ncbi:hypothetical protein FA13DRAFT_197977 [Coprinellus micaceus]|uniref:Uncharacterized protein n=1 Tax=Coprinellus micaceus TaxID=71717 RepID=A0A4Y7TGH6_COPMI|nr:hypothetical protein FA13DRAFT_197977 [Coprinellus micaceus]
MSGPSLVALQVVLQVSPFSDSSLPSSSVAGVRSGQGAFSYGATNSSASAYSDAAASTAAVAAAGASHGLQERPKYVYGQSDSAEQQQNNGEDDVSEHAHGAYSSEPQVQQSYNAESYGSYAAYDASAGYQDATRQYQGQEGYAQDGYAAQGYDAYGNHPYGQQQYAQGYDAAQYAQYDANQQYVVDPTQYAQYDQYATAGQQPAGGSSHAGAHPTRNDDAYGGM